MSKMEVGEKVNEIEGHEGEAEDDTDPFLTSFALKKRSSTCENKVVVPNTIFCTFNWLNWFIQANKNQEPSGKLITEFENQGSKAVVVVVIFDQLWLWGALSSFYLLYILSAAPWRQLWLDGQFPSFFSRWFLWRVSGGNSRLLMKSSVVKSSLKVNPLVSAINYQALRYNSDTRWGHVGPGLCWLYDIVELLVPNKPVCFSLRIMW